MMKALLYKEWIKMRYFYPLCAAVLLGFTAYALLRIERVVTFRGVSHVWEMLLQKETVFIELLRYLPLVSGVALAAVQFIPEMARKRLKLTLHLPYPQRRTMLLMTGFGLVALTVLFAVQAAALGAYLQPLLAPELVARILLTTGPWYAAGLVLYLLTVWTVIEPTWRRRVANLLIAAGVCRIFFLSEVPQAYDGMLPWLVGFLLCALFFPLVSVYRFRQGCQD